MSVQQYLRPLFYIDHFYAKMNKTQQKKQEFYVISTNSSTAHRHSQYNSAFRVYSLSNEIFEAMTTDRPQRKLNRLVKTCEKEFAMSHMLLSLYKKDYRHFCQQK